MTEPKLHCFFCAQRLKKQEASRRWSCTGCGASFEAGQDEAGCVIRLEVSDCGTPDCCRHQKRGPLL